MISVIIPCFNCEQHLGRAIESAMAQEIEDLEIILVDNNSTDGTSGLISRYLASFPERVIGTTEQKKGAPAARNRGLAVARGDWIQFLDADDELLIGKLKRQLRIAMGKSGSAVIAGAYYQIEPRRKYMVSPSLGDPWLALVTGGLGITSANLWKKSYLELIGGWNEDLSSSQDYDLLFRVMQAGGSVLPDPAPSCRRYVQENSISMAMDEATWARNINNYIQLRFRIRSYLQEAGLFDAGIEGKFNRHMYHHISRMKRYAPDFAADVLEPFAREVPPHFRAFTNIKFMVKNLVARR